MERRHNDIHQTHHTKSIRSLFYSRYSTWLVFFTLVIVTIMFSILSPCFLSLSNFVSIGQTVSVIGIIAIGQTLCIIVGGFDLSVGKVAALSATLVAALCLEGMPYILAFMISIVFGIIAGLINGFFVARLKINAFIVTLGFQSIYYGIAMIIGEGQAIIVPSNAEFTWLGTAQIFDMPISILIMLGLYVLFYLILNNIVFGRYIYCIGSNQKAAHIAGVNIGRIKVITYMISGLLSAFSGILLASRLSAAHATFGDTHAMDTISAAIIGGASLTGGTGKLHGTFFGVMLLGVITNGLLMMKLQGYFQHLFTGLILIIALVIHTIGRVNKKDS